MAGDIRRSYLNQRFSGSFSGLSGFLKNRKKWTSKAEVERTLRKLRGYALHKPIKKKFKRRKIMSFFINDVWGADLKDISTYSRENNNYKFVLIVIDCFSKKAYTVPLKNKSAKSMIAAFKKIFARAKAKPVYLHTDMGTEFLSSAFTSFLKKNNIKRYSIHSVMKSAIAERFIRMLWTKIQRYMTEKNTKKFINKLQDFTSAYNSSYHRSIGRTPSSVTRENSQDVWKHIFSNYLREKRLSRQRSSFKVGNLVRISREKLTFEKGK